MQKVIYKVVQNAKQKVAQKRNLSQNLLLPNFISFYYPKNVLYGSFTDQELQFNSIRTIIQTVRNRGNYNTQAKNY